MPSRGELCHVEMQKFAAEFGGEALRKVCLAGARRSRQHEDADRLAALLEGQSAADLRGHIVADEVLTHDFFLQRTRQCVGIDEDGLGLLGELLLQCLPVGQSIQYVHLPPILWNVRRRVAASIMKIARKSDQAKYARAAGNPPPVTAQPVRNLAAGMGHRTGARRMLEHELRDHHRRHQQECERHQSRRDGEHRLH